MQKEGADKEEERQYMISVLGSHQSQVGHCLAVPPVYTLAPWGSHQCSTARATPEMLAWAVHVHHEGAWADICLLRLVKSCC